MCSAANSSITSSGPGWGRGSPVLVASPSSDVVAGVLPVLESTAMPLLSVAAGPVEVEVAEVVPPLWPATSSSPLPPQAPARRTSQAHVRTPARYLDSTRGVTARGERARVCQHGAGVLARFRSDRVGLADADRSLSQRHGFVEALLRERDLGEPEHRAGHEGVLRSVRRLPDPERARLEARRFA